MKNLHIHRWQRMPFSQGRRGFSLAEIAIVLGIIGIVLAGAWVAVGSVNERNAINQAVQNLQTVAQNMIAVYQNGQLPAACGGIFITSPVIAAGVFPPTAIGPPVGGCQTGISPWGLGGALGQFEVWHDATHPPRTFMISFYNIPLDGCVGTLLQATACDPSQPGCPNGFYTATGAMGAPYGPLPPGGRILPAAGPPKSWSPIVTPATAAIMCGFNPPGGGSLEFEYAF